MRVIQVPFREPCICTASMQYSEQVGVNLHAGPRNGDMAYLYSLTVNSRVCLMGDITGPPGPIPKGACGPWPFSA